MGEDTGGKSPQQAEVDAAVEVLTKTAKRYIETIAGGGLKSPVALFASHGTPGHYQVHPLANSRGGSSPLLSELALQLETLFRPCAVMGHPIAVLGLAAAGMTMMSTDGGPLRQCLSVSVYTITGRHLTHTRPWVADGPAGVWRLEPLEEASNTTRVLEAAMVAPLTMWLELHHARRYGSLYGVQFGTSPTDEDA